MSCHWTDSSFVHRICHADDYAVVLLRDTYYQYCGVPDRVIQDWRQAESKGQFYNAKIKGRFGCGN